MDGYQFFASLFQSLTSVAWPAVTLACVWLLRDKLIALLPLLKMKYKDKDNEIDISFRLDKAEKEAKALPAPESGQEEVPATKTPEERSRFEQLVEISPRAAIAEIGREIEDVVINLAKEKRLPTGVVPFSFTSATRSLRTADIIDKHTSAMIDDLRAIRNVAVHAGNTEFASEDAIRFRNLADQLLSQLYKLA